MPLVGRSLYAFAQLLVLRLPNLVGLMLLTRYRGAGAAGLFGLAITYLILLTTWWVGLDELIVRETARSGDSVDQRSIQRYGLLRVGVSILLYLAVVGFLWFTGAYEPVELGFIAVFLTSSIADGFTGAVQAGLVGRERFADAFGMSAAQTVVRVCLVAAALLRDLSLIAVAWAWTLGAVAGVGIAIIALRWAIPSRAGITSVYFLTRTMRQWIAEGWAFLVIGILVTVEFQQDIIVLSAFQPMSTVGYYSAATTLFAAVALPIQALRMVLFPHMARTAVSDPTFDGDDVARQAGARAEMRIRNLHTYSVQWLLAAGLLFGFLGFAYAEPLIVLLFGQNMLPAVPSTRLLMVAIVFLALNVPQSRLLLATGRQNRTAALIAASTLANLLANLVLARAYGAPGAAVARNISTALYLALALFTLAGSIRRPAWPALVAPFVALAVAAAIALLLRGWLWWIAASIAFAVYVLTLITVLKATHAWEPACGSESAAAEMQT